MEEEERTFTAGQAEAMDALLSGRNVFPVGKRRYGQELRAQRLYRGA